MGAKGSKTKEKKRKGGHQLRFEDNNSTEPKSQAFQCLKREKSLDSIDIKESTVPAYEETAKENCPTASYNGKVSCDLDAGFHTISHRHSNSVSGRLLPPVPLSVVSEKECLDHPAVLAEQISTLAADDDDDDDDDSEPFTFPKEPVTSHYNGLELVDSQFHAIKEGSTLQKRDSIRRNHEGHYASMKTSNENHELGEIYEVPGYEESKNSEFRTENRPSASTGKCKTPSDGDLTYMSINAEQPDAGPVNNGPELTEDKTERNLAESERCINHDRNAKDVTEENSQSLTRVKTLESENWNKENGAADDDDPTSYAETCMTQNKLPKKGDTRLAVKPESAVSGHNQKAFRVSAFRTPNGGHADVEHLNFPNAAAEVPRFPSQNSSSDSQWLSNNTIKHMKIVILMKAECDTNVTCTVSLYVLIGLAGPSMITKCLEDCIQKHEKNNFKQVKNFEVPLLNCNCSSLFTVMVSNIKWLPRVDVVEKDIDSEVFEMNRFMNDSVVDPLFWHYLQLPKGLLKEQKFAATVSIQKDNCPEISFKIFESLQKVSDLSSVDVAKISQMTEDSLVNRRLCGYVGQTAVSCHSSASYSDLNLRSSSPDNNVLPDEITEKAKQLEHFVKPEPCGIYLPN